MNGERRNPCGISKVRSRGLDSDTPFFEDLFHSHDGQFDLFVSVIEMRGKPYTGLWSPVDQDLAGEQLAAHLLGIGHIDGDSASSLFGIAGSVDAPSVLVGELDEARRLTLGFFANVCHPSFADDFQSGLASFKGRNVRRAIHETKRRIGVLNRAGLEGHGILVSEPSGKFWLELFAQVGAHVKIRDSGPPTEPFKNTTAREIHVESDDIHWDSAEGLESVEHDMGADLVRLLDNRARVIYLPISSAVDFTHVERASAANLDARRAFPARLRSRPLLAIETSRENPRRGGLAHPANPGEQKRMRDSPALQRFTERPRNVLLPDQLGETLRPPFAREHQMWS